MSQYILKDACCNYRRQFGQMAPSRAWGLTYGCCQSQISDTALSSCMTTTRPQAHTKIQVSHSHAIRNKDLRKHWKAEEAAMISTSLA